MFFRVSLPRFLSSFICFGVFGYAEVPVPLMDEVVVEGEQSFRSSRVGSVLGVDIPAEESPQTINVLTRELLDARNVWDLDSAMKYDSSVFTGGASFFSRTSGQYAIRGYSGSDVLVQGMPLPSGMGTVFDTALVDSIDIVKGPVGSISGGQSSTLGPYGAGGSVVLNLKQPIADRFTEVITSGRIGKGAQSYRFSFDDNRGLERDGYDLYVRNIFSANLSKPFWKGNGADWGESYTFSPSFAWLPDSRTKFVLTTSFQYQDMPAYQGVPVLGGHFIGSYDSWPGGPSSRSLYKGMLTQIHGEWKLEKVWTMRSGMGLGMSDIDYNVWGLSAGSPDRTVSTLDYYNSVISTGMGNYEYAWSDVLNTNWNFYIQGLVSFSTWSVDHEFLVGLDYVGRHSDGNSSFSTTSQRFSIYDPTRPIEGSRDYSPSTSSDSTLQRAGVVLQDYISYGGWRFLAGVKLDEHFSDEGNSAFKVSPRTGISRYLGDQVVLFGNVAQTTAPNFGYKGENNRELTNSWTARQYETGIRVNPVNDLWASISWFNIEQKNTPEALPYDRTRYMTNGKSRSSGVDLSLAGSVTRSWSMYASYTYLHYKDIDQGQSFDRYAPHSFSIWQQYEWTGEFLNGSKIGVGYRFTDQYYATLRGEKIAENYTIPSSSVFDAAIEVPLPKDFIIPNSSVRFAIYNIFDKKYVASTRHAVQCFAGDPRTFELSFKAVF